MRISTRISICLFPLQIIRQNIPGSFFREETRMPFSGNMKEQKRSSCLNRVNCGSITDWDILLKENPLHGNC
ncbi:hypothetical protein D3C80_1592560 [compost metagenome]